MKLNNKGFAVTGIVYSLLILFLIVIILVLGILSNRRILLNKIEQKIKNYVNDDITNVIVCNKATDEQRTINNVLYGTTATGSYLKSEAYMCNVDGTNKLYFILSTSSNKVSLISYDTIGKYRWSESVNTNGPGLTNNDALYMLETLTSNYQNVVSLNYKIGYEDYDFPCSNDITNTLVRFELTRTNVKTRLPSYNEITCTNNCGWLNITNEDYWTSTANSQNTTQAYAFSGTKNVSDILAIKPVIEVYKISMGD